MRVSGRGQCRKPLWRFHGRQRQVWAPHRGLRGLPAGIRRPVETVGRAVQERPGHHDFSIPRNAARSASRDVHERSLDRAENEFKKAIELNPYEADAHLGASRVSQERGKFELAATQVEKALELNPRIPGGRLQRGVALWKLGRLEEAITELEAAHEAEPKVTQIVVTLGAVKQAVQVA